MDEFQKLQQEVEFLKGCIGQLVKSDRYTVEKTFQMLDGRNFQFATGTGTKFGTTTSQKMAFWNTTPVNQPNAVADPNNVGASYVQSEVQDISDQLTSLLSRMRELGLIAT